MITLNENWTDRQTWDAFVTGHPQGRFCHLFDYGQIVSCYGYAPVHLAFLKDGSLAAVLPGSRVNSLLYGRKLVSQPFSEYGGLLADAALSAEDIRAIATLLHDYAGAHRQPSLIEMHGNHGIPANLREDLFIPRNPHHIALLDLERPIEELWEKVVRYSVRKAVNQARKKGLEVFEECDEGIIRERFFPLYLKSMKRLGVPPHKIDYYLGCARAFGADMKIFWAAKDKTVLAGLLGFACGRRVNIVNIVSTPESWQDRPNDLIHWEFVKWAAENGYKVFDFGSVRYEGQMTYKRKWGCIFEEHKHYLMSARQSDVDTATFDSSSDSMARMSKIWARAVPLGVGAWIGPMIRKHLAR